MTGVARYQLDEPVAVSVMTQTRGLVERAWPAGELSTDDPDEVAALDHLVAADAARPPVRGEDDPTSGEPTFTPPPPRWHRLDDGTPSAGATSAVPADSSAVDVAAPPAGPAAVAGSGTATFAAAEPAAAPDTAEPAPGPTEAGEPV